MNLNHCTAENMNLNHCTAENMNIMTIRYDVWMSHINCTHSKKNINIIQCWQPGLMRWIFGMNNAPNTGSLAQPVDLQSSALLLCPGFPLDYTLTLKIIRMNYTLELCTWQTKFLPYSHRYVSFVRYGMRAVTSIVSNASGRNGITGRRYMINPETSRSRNVNVFSRDEQASATAQELCNYLVIMNV